jgi:stress response protein YsnF
VAKIKKEAYVKEEIVIGKKPRTETKSVSEYVTKEKVDTSSKNNNTIAQTS